MGGPRDELRDLSDTIDGLLERLEGSFAAQRRCPAPGDRAAAAHQLRTPLATMRASLDVALAKPSPVPAVSVADRLYGELDRVDRLLDGLLTLARSQHGDLQGAVTLSLDAVAVASLAARAEAIAARRLTVSLSGCPDGAWVTGNPELVCRMADNLVDNAIVHNERGGWVHVSVTADGPVASLVVENGGEVIDGDALAQLAQPFRRLGADRVGSDTEPAGLSIVSAIAMLTAVRSACVAGLKGACARIGLPFVMRVLVVEDVHRWRTTSSRGCATRGSVPTSPDDGLEAAGKLDINPYDVVVLDRDLPGLHGDTICRMVAERENPAMVLMLTASGTPGDRVRALAWGPTIT